MSLSVDGVWKAGVWATTVWHAGVWREGTRTASTSGVPAPFHIVKTKRKTLNLSDQTDRNRAAEFIKSQLALDRARAESLAALEAKTASGRKTKAQRAAEKMAAESVLAAETQRKQQLLDANNNDVLALIMMSVQ